MRPNPMCALLAAALSLVPSRGRADDEPPLPLRPSRVRVMGDLGARWRLDTAHTAFDHARGGFAAGLALWVDLNNPDAPFVLGLEAGVTGTRSEDGLRSAYETSLGSVVSQVGIVARWQPFDWLAPYARVAGGFGYNTWRLSPYHGGDTLGAEAFNGVGTAGVGVLVQTPRIFRRAGWRGGRLLLSVEGGMTFASDVDIAVGPAAGDADPELLPVEATSLGTVNASGPYLRVLVGLAL
jgi:hypothetical protein